MPSPFPGMNLYLEHERAWNDFHESFMPAARDVITAQVRPHFIAKINEHLFIHAVDVEQLSFIEIRDRDDWQLVTVIELLSPANKTSGSDRDQVLAKRRQLLKGAVHLVEIDLLRGGPRMPMVGLTECDYCVLVSRAESRPEAGVWPIRLRETLPSIPIPLRVGDSLATHGGDRHGVTEIGNALFVGGNRGLSLLTCCGRDYYLGC